MLQLAGVIIAPVAVLFMVYALFRYKRRTQQVSSQTAAMLRQASCKLLQALTTPSSCNLAATRRF